MNTVTWALVGMTIIIVMAIISNSGTTSQQNISHQIFVLTCHLPIQNGIDHLYFDSNGNFVAYDNISYNDPGYSGWGTYYQCTTADHTLNSPNLLSKSVKNYNQTLFAGFPSGWFVFQADTMSVLAQKAGAISNLIFYILTPINLNVLGHGIGDIGGVGLMFVIGIYALGYLGIAFYIAPMIAQTIRGLMPVG